MCRKEKNHNNIQQERKQNRCLGLEKKKNFKSQFNSDPSNLNIPTEIEHTSVHMRSLQSLFTSVNSKESSDVGVNESKRNT